MEKWNSIWYLRNKVPWKTKTQSFLTIFYHSLSLSLTFTLKVSLSPRSLLRWLCCDLSTKIQTWVPFSFLFILHSINFWFFLTVNNFLIWLSKKKKKVSWFKSSLKYTFKLKNQSWSKSKAPTDFYILLWATVLYFIEHFSSANKECSSINYIPYSPSSFWTFFFHFFFFSFCETKNIW